MHNPWGAFIPLVFNPAPGHTDAGDDDDDDDFYFYYYYSVQPSHKIFKEFHSPLHLGHVTFFRPCSLTDLSF